MHLSVVTLLIRHFKSVMSQGNMSWTTEVPVGEEFDTKTVEFLLSQNQKYLVFLLFFLAAIIIFANRLFLLNLISIGLRLSKFLAIRVRTYRFCNKNPHAFVICFIFLLICDTSQYCSLKVQVMDNTVNIFSVVLMFYKNQMTKMWPVLYVTVASCDHICGMSGECKSLLFFFL